MDEFLEEFCRKYFPQEAMDNVDNEFVELRQCMKSVREYEKGVQLAQKVHSEEPRGVGDSHVSKRIESWCSEPIFFPAGSMPM